MDTLFANPELDSAFEKVKAFFAGDVEKTILWFSTKNPMLGGVAPLVMVQSGRGDKLYKFIDESLKQNEAPKI